STSNSMELIEKGKKLATQKDQSYQLAQLLLEQSAFEIKEGKYDHCLKTVESMINICRIKEYKPTLVKAFSHLSFVKFDRGDYDGAFNGYENCLQLSRELKDSFGIAENLHNLAVVAKQQGKFDAALDYFNQSLEVVQQLGERFREASTIYNIGLLYGQQGNYELAETFLKKAEKLAKQQDNLLFELMTRSGLARVAIAKNDLTSANNYFEEVVTGFKSLGIADRRYADALIGLAVVQVDQNNPSIERTLAELKDLESSQNSSYINIAHGFLTGYYRLGCNENEEASKEFKNALRLAEESKLYEYQVNALVNLAMIEFSRYQKIPDISYRAEMEKYMNRVCELFGNQKDLFCQVKTKIIKALIRFLDFDYEIALHELQELKTLVSENMMVREQAEVETYLEKLQELSNTYLELSQEGKKEMEKEMELDRLKSKLEIDLDTYLKELQTRTMELLH
ncbi:MAG: tetratricopeptide repeat protein, partial [Candidatus Odinarchaeota archaeon]